MATFSGNQRVHAYYIHIEALGVSVEVISGNGSGIYRYKNLK